MRVQRMTVIVLVHFHERVVVNWKLKKSEYWWSRGREVGVK